MMNTTTDRKSIEIDGDGFVCLGFYTVGFYRKPLPRDVAEMVIAEGCNVAADGMPTLVRAAYDLAKRGAVTVDALRARAAKLAAKASGEKPTGLTAAGLAANARIVRGFDADHVRGCRNRHCFCRLAT